MRRSYVYVVEGLGSYVEETCVLGTSVAAKFRTCEEGELGRGSGEWEKQLKFQRLLEQLADLDQ
jgi:hypothetical protein